MLKLKRSKEKAFFVYQIYARSAEADERYDSAVIFLEKALRIDPLNTALLLHLGRLCVQMGNTSKGIANFQRVLSLLGWGNHPHAEEARREIYAITADRDRLQAQG